MEGNSDTRCRHNEAKYKILSLLAPTKRYWLPREIAKKTGLTRGGVCTRLSKLFKQGYIWRRKVIWAGEHGYMYRYLKPHGIRVLMGSDGLEIRMRIRELTGVNVSLNRKKPVPHEVLEQYRRAISK